VSASSDPPVIAVTLPPLQQPDPAVGYATWLQAITRADGSFLGFIPVTGELDPETGGLILQVPLTGATPSAGIILVPVTITYSAVQNFNPDVHFFSGPTDDALDFGPAAPQFTTFVVLAPPVNGRLFVLDPTTGITAWIEAAGVGPA
jgi:hypothetical protein